MLVVLTRLVFITGSIVHISFVPLYFDCILVRWLNLATPKRMRMSVLMRFPFFRYRLRFFILEVSRFYIFGFLDFIPSSHTQLEQRKTD
jgi:hypothetical protein